VEPPALHALSWFRRRQWRRRTPKQEIDVQGIVLAGVLAGLATLASAQEGAAVLAARQALEKVAERATAGVSRPRSSSLQSRERALELPFEAVELDGVRVLSTSGKGEAMAAAQAMVAARTLFREVTGLAAEFPGGCTVFLLRDESERDTFLARHPGVDEARRGWMQKMEGAGVPGTADWAFWVPDPAARREWGVRFAFDWFLRRTSGVDNVRQCWLHEGLGLYCADLLLGTRSTWFVEPKKRGKTAELAQRLKEPFARWLDLAQPLLAPEERFDLEEILHLEPTEMDHHDHLRAYALVAHLVETAGEELGATLTRLGSGEDPRDVLEEVLGRPLAEERDVLPAWLAERQTALARAEGRFEDGELITLWEALDPDGKKAAIGRFEAALGNSDLELVRSVRALLRKAPARVPAQEDKLDYYDPTVHAPAQPIPRKRLRETHARVKKMIEAVRPEPDPDAPTRAHDYDWGTGKVVRVGRSLSPDKVFHNALRGLPPDADLARATLLAQLDLAEERKLHAAFAHAYTDRDGNVYPLTLYEVWASGVVKEMPDVDTLGLLHELMDEWKRWVAPVAASQQQPLYELLNSYSLQCIRSRQLREMVADLYLAARPTVPAGYESLVFNLHAQWALVDDRPDRMARALPAGRERDAFLEALTKRCLEEPAVYASGRARAARLQQDVIGLRKVLAESLRPQ
jgi:hypothetical protein